MLLYCYLFGAIYLVYLFKVFVSDVTGQNAANDIYYASLNRSCNGILNSPGLYSFMTSDCFATHNISDLLEYYVLAADAMNEGTASENALRESY